MDSSHRVNATLIAGLVTAACALMALAFGAQIDSAGAQAAAVKPVMCAPPIITDPPGDQQLSLGPARLGEGPANSDLLSAYLSSSSGKSTVNFVIRELSKEVPSPYSEISYYFDYTYKEEARYVSAAVTPDGQIAYDAGTVANNVHNPDGSGAGGAFIEGKDGVVSMVLPKSKGGIPGASIEAGRAFVSTGISLVAVTYLPTADDADAKNANMPDCSTPVPTALPITVNPKAGAAKAASKKKKATVSLVSQGQVSGIEGTLLKGKTVVGSSKLASLNGAGKMTLKLKKAVKKGSYTLKLAGVPAGGSKTEKSATVKFS